MRPRVLVVDDQFEMAETLAEGLEERGYDATPCGSSADAAALLEALEAPESSASTRSSPICACPGSTGSRSSPSRKRPRSDRSS